MRSSTGNPFSPGSDTVPPVWAGRIAQIADWENVIRPRRMSGLPERGRTVLGEAGLGKSSLVRRIALDAERRGDWVTPQLRIPSGTDPLKILATAALRLADQASLSVSRERRLRSVLDRVRSVAVSGVSLTLDRSEGAEPYSALTDLLVEIGKSAVEQDAAVLIHVDEVQNVTDGAALSQLLIGLGDAATYEYPVPVPGGAKLMRALPIVVYLTGLPDFADMAAAPKGATFACRFATQTLGPIEDDDLRMALRPFVTEGWPVAEDAGERRIHMRPDAADRIVELCAGEPFLFQLAGERAWYAGTGDAITLDEVNSGWSSVRTEAAAHVERILDRLPDSERRMVEAMAGLAPEERTLTAIAKAMGLSDATRAGPTAQRLDTVRGVIDRGRPYRFRHRAVEAYLTSDWPRV